MKMTRYRQLMFLVMTCFSPHLWAGGVVGTTGPIDAGAMQDYGLMDYAEPPSERDPFTTSDKMYQLSGQQGANRTGGQGFVPFFAGNNLPKMRVRGFVHNNPGESMALLQIDGDDNIHLVQKGDEIGIQSRSGQPNAVLKIISVDQKKVEVQSGSLRQVIIVQ
jgi:hypothetical protein